MIDKAFFARFKGNAPARTQDIRQFEEASGVRLRADYVAFLMEMNGGEGFIGESCVMLWRLEDLLEWNRGYKASDFVPGLFLFGSDGGGEAFAFDRRSGLEPIVSVPFIPLNLDEVKIVAPDFRGFISWLSSV